MADTRFTALGLSGSGKTCYVLGMYYDMCVGIKGFTLTTENQTASKLDDWMDKLDDETGIDRFPAGTPLTDIPDYCFKLHYHNQYIMSFNWVDYGGGTLRAREDNPIAFESVQNSIKESTALYIFIDGDLLCEGERDDKIRKIKRKCAKTINPYITEFIQKNGENELPPIVFVITKSDLCGRYTSKSDMIDVLKEAFSSVFGSDNRTYIVAVSLGKDISDDNYSGDVEPINIHIPFFIGIYYDFLGYCEYVKYKIEQQEAASRKQISQNKAEIDYQKDRWFFTDYDQIEKSQKAIRDAQNSIEENRETLKKYKKLLGAVAGELMRLSDNFIYLEGEKEISFNTDEIYEL